MPVAEAPINTKLWVEGLPPWWFQPRTTLKYKLQVRYNMEGRMLYEFVSGDKEEVRSEARECKTSVNTVCELETAGM